MSLQEPIQKETHFIESNSERKTQSNFPPPLFDIPIHQTNEGLCLTEHRRSVLPLENEGLKKKDGFIETQACLSKREDSSLREECFPANLIECAIDDKRQKDVDSFPISVDAMSPTQENKKEIQTFHENLTRSTSTTFVKVRNEEKNELLKSLTESSQALNTTINRLIGVINDLGGKLDGLQYRIKSLEISQQSCKSYPGVDQSEILNSNVLNNEEGRFEKMSGHFKNGMNNTKIYSNSNTSPTSESVNTIYKKPTTNPFSSSDQLYSVSAQEETGRQRLEELRRIEAEREFLLEQQRKRSLLDKKAKELMETISLTHEQSPSSLFDENVERCELTKECKRYTTGFNPLFE